MKLWHECASNKVKVELRMENSSESLLLRKSCKVRLLQLCYVGQFSSCTFTFFFNNKTFSYFYNPLFEFIENTELPDWFIL